VHNRRERKKPRGAEATAHPLVDKPAGRFSRAHQLAEAPTFDATGAKPVFGPQLLFSTTGSKAGGESFLPAGMVKGGL
jgi:hypothetical protein